MNNPADPASIGLLSSELISNSLHFYGPEFLLQSDNLWPVSTMSELTLPPIDQLPETKCTANVLHIHEETNCESIIQQFSSLSKLQRVLAYCFRLARRKIVLRSADQSLGWNTSMH